MGLKSKSSMIAISVYFILPFLVVAQSSSDKIKACLAALSKDQKAFFKSSGHFAAHVNLLDSSERSVCFGVSLHLTRISKKDFLIKASAEDQTWQLDHRNNLEIVKLKGP